MHKIALDAALDDRLCETCQNLLVRRRREPPKRWVARRFCGNTCASSHRKTDRVDRFWSRVDKAAGPDGCWPWTGALHEKGYGLFGLSDKTWRAHRYALIASGVAIPDGMVVMHKCDNPPCCNPDHLQVGTSRANIHDMIAKGRARFNYAVAKSC